LLPDAKPAPAGAPGATPSQPGSGVAFLDRVFTALDRALVKWALLRPPETLPAGEGDVDVLVEPERLEEVRALVVGEGFVPLPWPGGDLHAIAYDEESDRFVWLHVQTRVRLLGDSVPAAAVLAGVERDGLPAPAPAWLFWILVLHAVDKGEVAARHRQPLTRLVRSQGVVECPLSGYAAARGLAPDELVALVEAEAWDALSARSAPAPSPAQRLRGRLGALVPLRSRGGMTVAVVGSDGAGKTTLVSGLHENLPLPTRTIYMGLTGGRLPVADALRLPGLVLAARLFLLGARYAVGSYHRRAGRIVLYDRYTLDGLVPSGTTLSRLGLLSRRFQAKLFPPPDLVIFLDASGATMHRRGGEYDEARLESWRAAYREIAASVPAMAIIDAEHPADAVRREAQRLILERAAVLWRRGDRRDRATSRL
jgi:thymidylate kinase